MSFVSTIIQYNNSRTIQENPPASSEKGTKAPRPIHRCQKVLGQELAWSVHLAPLP